MIENVNHQVFVMIALSIGRFSKHSFTIA